MKANEVILAYMKEHGITYRDVAERIGHTAQNVWNILNGKAGNKTGNKKGSHDANYKTIINICDAIGLKIVIHPVPGDHHPDALLHAAELEDVPFSTVQRLLQASGYQIIFRATD